MKNSKKQQDSNIERIVRAKCYSGIDTIPIWNWHELFRTNNLFHLLLVKKAVPKKQIPVLRKIYTEFYDAYLEEFGLNETAQEIRELRLRYISNMNAFLQGDKGAQTFVDIDREELREHEESLSEKQSIWELKGRMEVALKINIDIKKCSVIEFNYHLKIISEMNQQAA